MKTNSPTILTLLINTVTTIIEFLLSLRILLKLFGANSVAPFVNWVYETTSPLLNPFEGIFPAPVLEGGFIIEFSSFFALIIYATVGYFLIGLVEKASNV